MAPSVPESSDDTTTKDSISLDVPHAFHQNLPRHHKQDDGVPFITKFAAKKARAVIDLIFSIQLTEELYWDAGNGDDGDVDMEDSAAVRQEGEEETDDYSFPPTRDTLASLVKKCSRLQSQLSSLDLLKYKGISQREWCDCVLHLLKLVTSTVSFSNNNDEQEANSTGKVVSIQFENVGFIYSQNYDNNDEKMEAEMPQQAESISELEAELGRDFSLPTPARELLLSVLIHILSNKGPLRSVSNTSLYPEGDNTKDRILLILHWKTLFKTLLRTAPQLDEHKAVGVSLDSTTRYNTVVKRTVQLIRDSRRFFEQGIRPNGQPPSDQTAKEVWNMVRTDVLYHSHTHACYRGTIFLYLFTPSRCSEEFYLSVMPQWLQSWTNIDRCPEFDFLWLAMFCRARKHVSSEAYNWATLRRRLLTHASYWLQLPIGGVGDKSFPRAANPRSRSCPPRLKIFAGARSSYDEGIDFVAKIAKLLVLSLGAGPQLNVGSGKPVSEGTNDILRFLSFVEPYFNPSNVGSWTFTLGAFLHYFAYELCCRVGEQGGMDVLSTSHPNLATEVRKVQPGSNAGPIPTHELVAILNACLPLCQQALYSKNGHVGRAAEAAMVYLVQIDPVHATPSLLDFAAQALDVSAVNLAHQAPSALSALARLVQPALRSDPIILLSRLPLLLRLTLAGIDSNDQNKTIRTLILYRSLASWVPVGGSPTSWPTLSASQTRKTNLGTTRFGKDLMNSLVARRSSPEYLDAIKQLPEESLLRQRVVLGTERTVEMDELILEEACSAMSDWSLEFVDRVFELLRVSGEREKASKSASGMASRYSSADVSQARNYSRVLKECLLQVFCSVDDECHAQLTRSVTRFLSEETLPSAAKDASLLCQAVAAARAVNDGGQASPGLDALVPVLCDDLQHHSAKTRVYRIRCLAGAVRRAGTGVLKHKEAISKAVDLCLSSKDRHLFKTGCKLLRHLLSTLTESYAISTSMQPRLFANEGSKIPVFGRSAELESDPIEWHVPDKFCLEFAWMLLDTHICKRLNVLCQMEGKHISLLTAVDTTELRACLRIIRYSIRGGASVILDEVDMQEKKDEVPYEIAVTSLLALVSEETKQSFLQLRGRLCTFLVVLTSLIASETLYPNAAVDNIAYKKSLPLISGDPKVCKETTDIALLLLTRRGSAFRSQELRTIWKAQKQLASDFGLSALTGCMVESLQAANLYEGEMGCCYKDGEDGGKTIPRRLVVTRVQLFHDALQRSSSFEVPRSLRRLERDLDLSKTTLFKVHGNVNEFLSYLESLLTNRPSRALDTYEGILDGLFALSCHSNTRVRASSVSVIDYALTRFGWLGSARIPRLLSAIGLADNDEAGKFGLPSCETLVNVVDQQGKRKRLAESIKGICSIVSLQRSMKLVLGSEKLRHQFAQTLLKTDYLLTVVPPEELQKIVLYLQTVFSPFRSRFFWLPRPRDEDDKQHHSIIRLSLNILHEDSPEQKPEEEETSEKGAVHWRKLLMACWFLQTTVDHKDVNESDLSPKIWSTCFHVIETQSGQPLQRVALGLLGKLISLSHNLDTLSDVFRQQKGFTQTFADALVYDHREDSSMSGGHDAQWSSGVEDMLRDSARHISPRNLFPFQRTSQSTGSFKVSHCQMIENILLRINIDTARSVWPELLEISRKLAAAPPSEDQRNQHITSAEIFAGLCGTFLRGEVVSDAWESSLLQHLDEVMGKIPFSLSGAYFDAIRYALQFSSPTSFFSLTKWLVNKIEGTLWQPSTEENSAATDVPGPATEGFTEQSKWLYLFSAVLIELDEKVSHSMLASVLLRNPIVAETSSQADSSESWQLISNNLLSRLSNALGHPFDSCRDHVSRCLFRICYCHRKQARVAASRGPSRSSSEVNLVEYGNDGVDPGALIVAKLASLTNENDLKFTDRYNSLSTARRFISYCVQLGEAKAEYSEYVIPLLPLVFEALKSTVEDEITEHKNCTADENTAKRALESEVTKQFRFAVAEISVTTVISYGKSSDIGRVLNAVESASTDSTWQVRHASANFLRCFQGAHKYLFDQTHVDQSMTIVGNLLADERREVSDAAMAALTGIFAASPEEKVATLVKKFSAIAGKSKMRRKKGVPVNQSKSEAEVEKEQLRAKNQQRSVFFLCSAVMAHPYDTPLYVPVALAAISKHSFERSAPLNVRDTVKKCCSEYKKTHMSDNWALHKSAFTEAQLEALEDVVSSPHYYA